MNPHPSSVSDKRSVYDRITDRIVQSLQRGVRPWVRPWNGARPFGRPLRHDATPYSGINVLALWCTALERGYSARTWMTFRQAFELGGHVRKGETGTLVVYAGTFSVASEEGREEESPERQVRFLKGYTVFNVEQIDGLPDSYAPPPPPAGQNRDVRLAHAEQFLRAAAVPIRHGGDRAYYSPGSDAIQLPPFEAFRDAESYYATALHELVHSTAHPDRLGRELGKRFGDRAYAAEELVAEIGAAFLCADLGISAEPRDDHAAYLAIWLEVLKADSRAIFTAAAQAERAGEFLHALSRHAE